MGTLISLKVDETLGGGEEGDFGIWEKMPEGQEGMGRFKTATTILFQIFAIDKLF